MVDDSDEDAGGSPGHGESASFQGLEMRCNA